MAKKPGRRHRKSTAQHPRKSIARNGCEALVRWIATVAIACFVSYRLSLTMIIMQAHFRALDEPRSLYSPPNDIVEDTAAHNNATNISTNINAHSTTSTNAAGANDEPPHPHPHAGARSANGSWGYVADVYRVRKHIINQYHLAHGDQAGSAVPLSYLPFSSTTEFDDICNTPPPKATPKEMDGYRLLSTKVHVNSSLPINHNLNQSWRSADLNLATETSPTTTKEPLRILCAMYTHEGGHFRLPGLRDTWTWRCDGFFAASTKTVEDPTNESFGAIDLPHMGAEAYGNMWQKVRSIWSYMYDNYLDDFDFFYLCGDDTHLIVENLRNYLASIHNPEYPAYLGQVVHGRKSPMIFGGPGYVLNRKALKILIEDVFPVCRVYAEISAEDRFITNCFRKTAQIVGNDTVDAFGSQRFHGRDPDFIAVYNGSTSTREYYKTIYDFWGSRYGYRTGIDLVSTQSVSFHMLRTGRMMKRHHAILYRSCPTGTALGDALANVEMIWR